MIYTPSEMEVLRDAMHKSVESAGLAGAGVVEQ
jgi:hypothetical protein